jgi:hypothetical protein
MIVAWFRVAFCLIFCQNSTENKCTKPVQIKDTSVHLLFDVDGSKIDKHRGNQCKTQRKVSVRSVGKRDFSDLSVLLAWVSRDFSLISVHFQIDLSSIDS